MKSRERLLSALRHEGVDRLPWTALATGYYWRSLPNPLSEQLGNLVSLLKYVGADILDLCFDAPAIVIDPRAKVIKETVDGLESVTPPPTGNLELPEAMRALGDKLFIIGGLDAPSFRQQSPKEVNEWMRRLLSQIPSQEGLILEVTDDVSPNTPLENLKAVGQTILAYG